ncbi:hypothetical protein S245_014491 [Arachis hypogaea]
MRPIFFAIFLLLVYVVFPPSSTFAYSVVEKRGDERGVYRRTYRYGRRGGALHPPPPPLPDFPVGPSGSNPYEEVYHPKRPYDPRGRNPPPNPIANTPYRRCINNPYTRGPCSPPKP